MKKALLVIDMQNICVGENHSEYFKYDNTALLSSVNKAISGYEPDDVYYILNVMKNNIISKLSPVKVYEGSNEAKLADGLSVVSDNKFIKFRGNAFSNPGLTQALKSRGVGKVEIVGVDGAVCISKTALGAVKEGFKVTVNTKAVGTMAVKQAEKLYSKLKSKGAEFI